MINHLVLYADELGIADDVAESVLTEGVRQARAGRRDRGRRAR